MLRSKKNYLLATVVLLFLFWQFYENQNIKIQIVSNQGEILIYNIPRKDKKKIESFFYLMFITGPGAYTLFESKAMSVGIYLMPLATSDWRDFLSSIFPMNLRVYQGWKTWQQYQPQFPILKFAMWEEKNSFRKESDCSKMIILVHKQKLQEIIDNHSQDFQTVLGRQELTSELLLQRAQNKTFLGDVLHGHEGLIGTIFGFGRDNAWLFETKKQGKVVQLSYVWEENTEVKKSFETRPYIAWSCFGIPPHDTSHLTYPGFMADLHSTETKELQEKFIQTRSEILNFYQGKDLVEATLDLLINGVPNNDSI